MARKPRIELEGALYHVITRGNQKQRIFKATGDYTKYLEILTDYKDKYRYFLYAYALMNNHVHLLIETQQVPLSKLLQGIDQRYTMYFNWKYKTVGHLFQGRYKAILCDKDQYLLSLIKYIHLNPVRRELVKSPEEYPWSSHRFYSDKSDEAGLVDAVKVLRMFSEDMPSARREYRIYMGEGPIVSQGNIYGVIDQRILGDEGFVAKVMPERKDNIRLKRRPREYTLSELADGIQKVYGVKLKEMQENGKGVKISLGRKLFSLVASEHGYKGKEMAEYIRKDPAMITRYLKDRKDSQAEVERLMEMIAKK